MLQTPCNTITVTILMQLMTLLMMMIMLGDNDWWLFLVLGVQCFDRFGDSDTLCVARLHDPAPYPRLCGRWRHCTRGPLARRPAADMVLSSVQRSHPGLRHAAPAGLHLSPSAARTCDRSSPSSASRGAASAAPTAATLSPSSPPPSPPPSA